MVDTRGLSDGRAALRAGDWAAARDAFTREVERTGSPEALEGLGIALWWSKDVRASLQARAQAYAAFRQRADDERAGVLAAELAREHRALFRDEAVAAGWLARARSVAERADGPARGWLRLAEAEASPDPLAAIGLAGDAVLAGREHGDADLEIAALARLGELEVSVGRIDAGVEHLDEAMAAATAGEGRHARSVGEACCALLEVTAMLGDAGRFTRWAIALDRFRETASYLPLSGYAPSSVPGALSAFCSACCGGVYLVTGRIDDAESELLTAIAELEEQGMQSRCVHPVTQLAEVRVAQGRLEEAVGLLEPYEDLDECVRPLAVLDLALGAPETACDRLRRGIAGLGARDVSSMALQFLLVQAEIAVGDTEAAGLAAGQVVRIAALTGSRRHLAQAAYAQAKVATALGAHQATEGLRAAAGLLADAQLPLLACRARMDFARAVVGADRSQAVAEARGALASFERLGASADADAAAAFLRELGVRGRTGPKDAELLSRREKEVLRLVAEGLSNAEIAARLFISIKTAGHHVSNILTKLGVRSRTEAAAFAALHLGREPVGK